MLDEVDKVGADFRGDPSAALLEVLDPEQNFAFVDHYLAVPFDLSNVMFITTANLVDPIIPALKDRMEVIHLAGYTEEEKRGIARQYLIPRQMTENGVTEKDIHITDQTLALVISQYTRESGLRNLEREIANICRKVARKIAEGRKTIVTVTPTDITNIWACRGTSRRRKGRRTSGVATGLAWTETGGDILYIEATTMKGKGSLTLTGHLGEVMKESAQAALSYVRSRAPQLGIKEEVFGKTDIHIHVPAGAIPKDGPSAGVTMATAITSALTGRAVDRDVAMTGEVRPGAGCFLIGGLNEKTLAAREAG
jgi:ATP-dependent Lon protease